MRHEDDALIAELALRNGWLARSKLRRAMEIRDAARAAGLDTPLLDILVEKRFLAARDANELREQLDLSHLCKPDHAQAIAGYAIQGKLDDGGIATTFRAVQLSMDRPVALHVLAPAMAKRTEFLERFLQEGRTAGQVSHPNLVGALDLGRSGDYYYFATELPDGPTLRDTLRAGPLGVNQALTIAHHLAQALAHLHELQLTHRDVQPANIILGVDGAARLSHVGHARLPDDPSVIETGIPIGTPEYAAPELAAGSPSVDIRADIYSLGATLHHVLAGQPPKRSAPGEPITPSPPRPDVPQPVCDLIARMSAPNPDARPQTPSELVAAIEATRRQLAPQGDARPAPALPPTSPPPNPPQQGASVPRAEEPPAIAPAPTAQGPCDQAAPQAQAPRPRPLARLAWPAAFAALAAALAAASIWALRSHFQWPVATPSRPPTGTAKRPRAEPSPPPRPAPPQPEPPQPIKPPASPPRAAPDPAAILTGEALAFDRANPDDHAGALLRLRRALLAAEGSPNAAKLEARLAARQQALSSAANTAYNALSDRLSALRREGRLGAAIQACGAFPASLRHGPWADRVDARLAELAEEAERNYLSLATKGATAFLALRPDEALACYKAIPPLGIPWISRVGETLVTAATAYADEQRARLAEAVAQRALLDRRTTLGLLTKHFARVQEEVKKRDYAKALEICSTLPASLRDGERAKAVAYLERRLTLMAELWNAILKGPQAAIGMAFPLHGAEWTIEGFVGTGIGCQLVLRTRTDSGDRTLRYPIWRLPPTQLAKLAEWATAREPKPVAAIKLAILLLTEGEATLAREKLKDAEKTGADIAPYLDELEADLLVTAALTAHRQKQWPEARKLLETALDRFGATPPVILNHPTLTNALGECLARLGEPAGPPQVAPAPLPPALRAFVLLPECLISPSPPADPLQAHFGSPLRRASPVRLGLDNWDDYTLTLRWTAGQQTRLVLAARLTEPQPGQFRCYYVALDDKSATLGLQDPTTTKTLASQDLKPGAGGRNRYLTFTLAGQHLAVDGDAGVRLEATDATLTAGQAALSVPDAPLAVQDLLVSFRAPRLPARPPKR